MRIIVDAMGGAVTVEISRSVRDTQETTAGEYIGFIGKDIIVSEPCRSDAVCKAFEKQGFENYDICLLIKGADADMDEALGIESYIKEKYRGKEVYLIDGKQKIYDYILIFE